MWTPDVMYCANAAEAQEHRSRALPLVQVLADCRLPCIVLAPLDRQALVFEELEKEATQTDSESREGGASLNALLFHYQDDTRGSLCTMLWCQCWGNFCCWIVFRWCTLRMLVLFPFRSWSQQHILLSQMPTIYFLRLPATVFQHMQCSKKRMAVNVPRNTHILSILALQLTFIYAAHL